MRTEVDDPPTRRGHYSADGSRWWDDEASQWYEVGPEVDTLVIGLEDHGHATVLRSLATTLTGPFGAQSFRFVARASSDDPRWPTYRIDGPTFPVLPLQLPLDRVDPASDEAYDVRQGLESLDRRLVEEGWRRTGTGDHWWAWRYERPRIHLPPEGQPSG